jgi:tRNA threonylcarbamoyladenosine dehydratase
MDERFQRTQGILSPQAIQDLSEVHILIAGVGGAGGQVAIDLARLGVGKLTLADFDVYVRHNMNRQIGCFESTLGQRKIDVVARICTDINPEIAIRKVPEGITAGNCSGLVRGGPFPAPHFVLEVIDGASVSAKVWLHDACREQGITVLSGIMLGFGASLVTFPPEAPAYGDLFVAPDGRIDLARLVPRVGSYVIREIAEECFAGRGHAPTCVVGATTAAAMMVTEMMRGILLGKQSMVSWPDYLYVDLFDHVYQRARFGAAEPLVE